MGAECQNEQHFDVLRPHQKNLAGGKILKGAGNGILRGFTPNQDRTGGWGKGGGKFRCRRHGSEAGGVLAAPQHSWNHGARFGKAGNGSLAEKK